MKRDLENPTLAHRKSQEIAGSGAVSQINTLRGYIHPIDHSDPTICQV